MDPILTKLSEALIGWTVIGVSASTRKEILCTLILTKGEDRKKFDLHARDLADWIAFQKSPQAGLLTYTNFNSLLEDVCEHAAMVGFEFIDPDVDPQKGVMGFRCRNTGKEWLCSTSVIRKVDTWWGQMSTGKGRQRAVRILAVKGPKIDPRTVSEEEVP